MDCFVKAPPLFLSPQAGLQHAGDLGRGGPRERRQDAALHPHDPEHTSSLHHRLRQQHLQGPESPPGQQGAAEITASPL